MASKFECGYPAPGDQTPSGTAVMESVFFLDRVEWDIARTKKEYDFVVVGTGFCCLAFVKRALSHNPKARILIIERGPFFLPEHFQNLPMPIAQTLGGKSETFPWTVAHATHSANKYIKWQHGMVPFFGGRSTLWSAWCPRPTDEEMEGWPSAMKQAAVQHFESAEALLHVKNVDELAPEDSSSTTHPVYGNLQKVVQARVDGLRHASVYRVQAAPLACSAKEVNGVDFMKYSTPGDLLALVTENKDTVDIAVSTVVTRIVQYGGVATAIETNKGLLSLGNAKLILAMGTLPPATLLANSFPKNEAIGKRFSAHFISAIIARVPRRFVEQGTKFGDLELGAIYIGGIARNSYAQQFHIQMSVLSDRKPEQNSNLAQRYMPDVVATASRTQLLTSKDHVVIVCAVLGELDSSHSGNFFKRNPDDHDHSTNSVLQIKETERDLQTWDAMDEATFHTIEHAIAQADGQPHVEYWHPAEPRDPANPDAGEWRTERTNVEHRRVPGLVHESSVLWVGATDDAPVDTNYKVRTSENVFVTGGGLWPRGGSWNPTMAMVGLAQDLADKLSVKHSPS